MSTKKATRDSSMVSPEIADVMGATELRITLNNIVNELPTRAPIFLPTDKIPLQEQVTGLMRVRDIYRSGLDSIYRPRLRALREQYQHHSRCFVIGNGPSLNRTDLSALKGEVTFAVNGFFLKAPELDWTPTFYVVEDHLVGEDRRASIEAFKGPTKLFPAYLGYCFDASDDTIFFNHRPRKSYPHGFDFSTDAEKLTYAGCTVTFTCLQLAYYFGFKEIYVVGVDADYAVPADTEQKTDYGVGIFDMKSDDPNHFHPDYFGKGFRWHDPQVDKMVAAFAEARRVVDSTGRSIFNATVGGKLEVFERVPFSSLFAEPRSPKQMERASLPRLLLFDITKRGDGTATGNLKATLFADWPDDRLLQFCSAGRARVGVDGAVPKSADTQGDLDLENISRLVRLFAPDVILYRPVPDNLALHEAAMSVIRSTGLPLAVWIMDDWPCRLASDDPELFARLDWDLRELLARADLRLSISDAMSAAFADRYKVPFKAFANAIDPMDWPLRPRDDAKAGTFVVRYAGALAKNMGLDSVRRVAGAVERLARDGVDIRFEISTGLAWQKIAEPEFRGLTRTNFRPESWGAAYREWLSQADALLIAYNFDEASKTYTRYSLANKLPECLASGAALIAHGPSDVATISYVASLNCAIVVADENERALADALRSLALDPRRRRDLSERARAIAFDAHNVHRVRRALGAELLATATRKTPEGQVKLPEYGREAHAHLDETQVISVLLGASTGTEPTMIDVGAHLGSSTRHFVDKGWRIYCFEPDTVNRESLIATFGNRPNVTIDARAIGEKAELGRPFFSSEESTGISGLHAFRDTHQQTALVDLTCIADVVVQHGLDQVDFLKIDTEGWDLAVLRGVPWDRLRPAVIECEFEDSKTTLLGSSYQRMADFLLDKGYTVYVSEWHPIVRYGVPHDWCRLARYPQSLRSSQAWGNLLAFLTDPGAEAMADALKACVRLRKVTNTGETTQHRKDSGVPASAPQRAEWSLAALHRRIAGWMTRGTVAGVAVDEKAVHQLLERHRLELSALLREARSDTDRRIAALESRVAALDKNFRYWQTIRRICDVASAILPQDATVLVVSKGDDQLLQLNGRQAWHFPRAEDGAYTGYYPKDSAAAIAHLEALRAEGADFLLVPSTAFWWFDHYSEFKRHLDDRYQRVRSAGCCAIYRLSR